MSRWRLLCGWALLACSGAAWAQQVQVLPFDPAQSRFGFEIRTRFGQRVEGLFPRFDGTIEVLPDGRHRVHLVMYTAQVEIPGRPRHTQWMRSEDFFDAAHFPQVEFLSDPYDPALLASGGSLVGTLTLRGVSRVETLTLMPAGCDRPGYDCDVISRGTVLRGRYGMDSWQVAVSDRVTFILRARLAAVPSS